MNAKDSSVPDWQAMVNCLRTELAEYGALLALFSQQQKFLFERDAAAVLGLSVTIEQQVRLLEDCRRSRDGAVAAFAAGHGQPPGATLRSLLPFVESVARPLVEALIGEVNHLVHRVRRTSRHNHTLLARTVEVHQEILQQLRPHAFTKTYSSAGRVSVMAAQGVSTLRTAG